MRVCVCVHAHVCVCLCMSVCACHVYEDVCMQDRCWHEIPGIGTTAPVRVSMWVLGTELNTQPLSYLSSSIIHF